VQVIVHHRADGGCTLCTLVRTPGRAVGTVVLGAPFLVWGLVIVVGAVDDVDNGRQRSSGRVARCVAAVGDDASAPARLWTAQRRYTVRSQDGCLFSAGFTSSSTVVHRLVWTNRVGWRFHPLCPHCCCGESRDQSSTELSTAVDNGSRATRQQGHRMVSLCTQLWTGLWIVRSGLRWP